MNNQLSYSYTLNTASILLWASIITVLFGYLEIFHYIIMRNGRIDCYSEIFSLLHKIVNDNCPFCAVAWSSG